MAMDSKRDVIVVGGGIFGLSVAWSCIKRGLSVTLLEKASIGAGASGGIMGAMSPNVPENWSPKKQFQVDALLSAADHWREVDSVSGISSGYGRIGRVLPIADEKALNFAKIREVDAKTLWGGKADWRVVDTKDYEGWIAPGIAPLGVVYENFSARINPRQACLSLAKALEIRGCDIREGWCVTDIGDNEVSGPDGKLTANSIVIAAGVGTFPLVDDYFFLNAGVGVKGQAAMLGGVDAGNMPMIFAQDTYVIPHANGQIAVGSTSENKWDDPYSIDEKLDQVLAKARDICPSLASSKILHCWADLRPRGRKPDPMLGPIDGPRGLFLASGGFKIGFGIAHMSGEVLADMITQTPYDLPKQFFARYAAENRT